MEGLPQVVVNSLSEPSDLVIDHQSRVLYWSELSGSIRRIGLDGNNQEVVYSSPSIVPFKIALYKEYLLWIDGTSGSFNVVHRGNTDIRGSVPVPSPATEVLNGLLVVGTNRQLSLGELVSQHSHSVQILVDRSSNECFLTVSH